MKKVISVYDDRFRPSAALKLITGNKSFGSMIFRRRTFSEIMGSMLPEPVFIKDYEEGAGAVGEGLAVVLHVFSHFACVDENALSSIVNKAAFASENYCVMCGNKCALIIFSDTSAWREAYTSHPKAEELQEYAAGFPRLDETPFVDISGRNELTRFITGGFEARYFNSVSGDEHTLVKRSVNKEKLKAEYTFYQLLPDEMKSFFVMPYDYRDEGVSSSYRMERLGTTDLAIRYCHGAISMEEFGRILDRVFYFLEHRKSREADWDEFYRERRRLYIEKVEQRMEQLKGMEGYNIIAGLIASGTPYPDTDALLAEYEQLYDGIIGKEKENLRLCIGHGDLCFSNILYAPESDMMRLIDPKGATGSEGLYMDPMYDIAKLSHSICGGYDFMNSGLYEITLEEDMKFRLRIDANLEDYIEEFRQRLQAASFSFRQVRLFECSLFLSMLPLHMDRPQKVMAFILNAVSILKELKVS